MSAWPPPELDFDEIPDLRESYNQMIRNHFRSYFEEWYRLSIESLGRAIRVTGFTPFPENSLPHTWEDDKISILSKELPNNFEAILLSPRLIKPESAEELLAKIVNACGTIQSVEGTEQGKYFVATLERAREFFKKRGSGQ